MRKAGLIVLAIIVPAFVYASALVNINTADATLLDTLPGIGPTKAAAIVDYRTKHGPFKAIADIQNVNGIGPVTFTKLKPLITVDTVTVTPIAEPMPQPFPQPASYKKVQTVEKITSPQANIPLHAEAVNAPATTAEPAAAGAALAPLVVESMPSASNRDSGIFHSPWTFGLFGVIVLAGGAFIFL